MHEYEEIVTKQETLKIHHDEKIETVLKAYPPEKGFEVEIIECKPIDSKTEIITFSIKRRKNFKENIEKSYK